MSFLPSVPSARAALFALWVPLLAACGRWEGVESPVVAAGEPRNFSGTMTLSGLSQVLPYVGDRPAATFQLGGTALLAGEQRPALGYRTEIVGYTNSVAGMRASCVWTDRNGERAFSELRAEEPGPDRTVIGTFVGGTGRYAGITGEYRFTWQHMTASDEGGFGARVADLRGWVRFADAGERREAGDK